jgi:hypothetical protein
MKKIFEVQELPYEDELHQKPLFLSLESLLSLSNLGCWSARDERCELEGCRGAIYRGGGVGIRTS